MQKTTLTLMILLFGISLSYSQSYPTARYLNVDSDKHIIIHSKKEFCSSCSESIILVDGDESESYVELNFNYVNSHGTIQKAELIMNCPDVEWAESGEGFSVYINDVKIGSITKIERNRMFSIKLNASELNKHKKVTFTLKANGADGTYLYSKHSGFGAVLKLQY